MTLTAWLISALSRILVLANIVKATILLPFGWVSARSVRAVGVGLVVRDDRLLRDAAVRADLEARPERPVPDLAGTGVPPRPGDLGTPLAGTGQADGLGDELSGTLGPLHGQLGEHGASKLIRPAAGPLALQAAHGLGELVQGEVADQVVEQTELAARWTRRHATTVTGSRAARHRNVTVPAMAEASCDP
jgi:hypothetical protein